jgi:hypothetical protein
MPCWHARATAGAHRAARTAPLRDVLGLPLAFVAMHIGWGAGMWRGFIASWRSQRIFQQQLDQRQPRQE